NHEAAQGPRPREAQRGGIQNGEPRKMTAPVIFSLSAAKKTTARGYGYPHQQLQKRWKPLVQAGLVDCARCGKRILPGEPWDLGHDDYDRTRYSGPEHRRCNRATQGRKRRTSRKW